MGKIIGIDLGTTNSAVAVLASGTAIIIPTLLGDKIIKSAVRFLENGESVVGQKAYEYRILDSENTITGIKRFIGRQYNEVFDIAATVPYKVEIGHNNLAMINTHGTAYTPQYISAMILKFLKVSAEAYLGEEVTEAIITIPAYFNEQQRQATKEAAEMAGLNARRIINEPTAAALAYGYKKETDQYIAVFDLGGGTFDITILELTDGVFEVKSISGDGFLGGDDFDNLLLNWISEELTLKYGIRLAANQQAMELIRKETVAVKCELSISEEETINIPFLYDEVTQYHNLSLTVTRKKFEEICEELFERLILPCENALKEACLSGKRIDKVILVGGATRMPKVSEIVKKVFEKEPSRSVNPDEAVALGAAIQGAVLTGDLKNVLLLDVTPASVGFESQDGVMVVMIPINTTIPSKKSEICSTAINNQSSIELHILEGEETLAINNKSLGRLILEGLAPAPAGKAEIEVIFDIDANGILRITAREKSTGKEEKVRVKVSTGMSEDDLAQKISSVRKI